MTEEEKKRHITERYLHLIDVCKSFVKKGDLQKINKAYEFALKAQLKEKNENGRLNIEHSIEVAIICVEKIGLGTTSVVCTLLHNLLEKDDAFAAEVEKKFGKTVSTIANGFRKLSGISTQKVSYQSENFRRLYLSLVDDIRVVLIKLAHRLHDMRVIQSHQKEKQKKILAEVNYIYIPIAHRLGLYSLKEELEEMMMRFEHKDIYEEISEKLQATRTKRNVFIHDFTEPIRKELIRQGFDVDIKGRPKSIHSIWNKMKKQNLQFEELYDLFAIRIISNSDKKNEKADCWRIYSIVTDLYEPNPKRLRDWISTPKASGYESLHTTVKATNEKWVEVQIRSKRMDELAEKGQAAHWRYKGFSNKKETEQWVNQVRDILENPNQIDFDEMSKSQLNAKSDKIFVFTPGGDLKKLERHSTVLDFAYEIHTDIGDKCSGASVNAKNVPIRHELKNGDKVQIITSNNQKPKYDWLNFVVTSKAKSKIKRAIFEEKFKEAEVGNEIIRRKFKNWKIPFNEESIDRLIKHYKFKSSIDLYYAIATEKIDLLKAKSLLTEESKTKGNGNHLPKKGVRPKQETLASPEADDTLIIDEKLKDVNYNLAKCCNPVWGDPVFGFITIGKGITIHRINCPNATRLLAKYGYRIIDVKWKAREDESCYQTYINVKGLDKMGIMGDVANAISNDLKVNMLSLNVNSKKEKFEGRIKVQVRDIDHLDQLLHRLTKIPGIESARRVK
ncbi:MAG: RelA/SpoT family protein [Bacteroidales bacterium]|nr:RelA/SpoT family protein [Bacteroidales bacterium]MCF8349629.1 RelA/SpoT family protein [Bacteroidales bacterium]MCF8376070.1 RelA/SpoT family protein [Bacteroidales bacterium]MCF8400397.1 RelA/SpoT family protein [Bacteroidales bacterium]